MPTTVDIVVKGIALWFKKDNFWNALLPFDDCHNVDFSYRSADGPPNRKRSLARKNGKIKIYLSSDPNPSQTPAPTTAFDNQVFNLTSQGPSYITHRQIRKKANWADNAVYLRIGSAKLSVFDYVQDLTDDPLLLHGTITRLQRLDSIAHWVKATIEIPDGENLHIEINGAAPILLPGTGGGTYHVVINNDCRSLTKQNDMKMYYDYVINGYEDATATVAEQYWLGELKDLDPEFETVSLPAIGSLAGHSAAEFKTALKMLLEMFTGGTASLEEGKPCMNVKATDPGDLPSFP